MVFLYQKQHYIYLKNKKIWVGQYTKVLILPDSYRQWLLNGCLVKQAKINMLKIEHSCQIIEEHSWRTLL